MCPCLDIVLGNPEFGLHLKKLSRDGARCGPRGLLEPWENAGWRDYCSETRLHPDEKWFFDHRLRSRLE